MHGITTVPTKGKHLFRFPPPHPPPRSTVSSTQSHKSWTEEGKGEREKEEGGGEEEKKKGERGKGDSGKPWKLPTSSSTLPLAHAQTNGESYLPPVTLL